MFASLMATNGRLAAVYSDVSSGLRLPKPDPVRLSIQVFLIAAVVHGSSVAVKHLVDALGTPWNEAESVPVGNGHLSLIFLGVQHF